MIALVLYHPGVKAADGAIDRFAELVRAGIGERVMLVTDPGMVKTGIVDRALKALKAADVAVEVFSDVEADPPEHIILTAAERYAPTHIRDGQMLVTHDMLAGN